MSLPKYTLHKDKQTEKWRLEREGSDRAKKVSDRKEDAVRGLRAALGAEGGSVRIRKTDGTIQEERTYPRSMDPRSSKG